MSNRRPMRLRSRLIASAILVALALLLGAGRAFADAPAPLWDEAVAESDDAFFCIQHALAAEGRNQSPLALLEKARALRDKGDGCFRSRGWLSSWGVAVDVLNDPERECARQYHCQGYFRFESIPPHIREPLAVASHIALTEDPPVRRYHFTGIGEPLYDWWFSSKACPNGYFEEDRTRYC